MESFNKTGGISTIKIKVLVILDEYDAAVMRLLYDKERLEAMRTMLREFYQVLKDEGAYLKFVFITGVTKFSQMSISSDARNITHWRIVDEEDNIVDDQKFPN